MYSAALNTILRDVVIILLTRLMQKRTERWVQGFIKALFTTIAVGREGFGSEELIAAFDGVQPGSVIHVPARISLTSGEAFSVKC